MDNDGKGRNVRGAGVPMTVHRREAEGRNRSRTHLQHRSTPVCTQYTVLHVGYMHVCAHG